MVDDAIVMIENIHRHSEMGLTPMQAALAGARQIGFTVISISVSLVAVFIPILFMGGILGKLFHEFALVLTVAIATSAVVSLTLTPMMCGVFGTGRPPIGVWAAVDARVERGFAAAQAAYARSLGWTLRQHWLALFVTPAIIAGIVALWIAVPKGFLPIQDTGLLVGSTLAAARRPASAGMEERQQRVVDVILSDPAVESVGSIVGVSSGFGTANRGQLTIALKPLSETRHRQRGGDRPAPPRS